ncbi:MAG: glutamine--fructose-6-phosphate transaminase (isomerizing) [Patescibacteria group bacterium]|nr:glutamine--fructose-6-phosphate transaminase (isomerizing) [Patescibacteria group bacterium]MDD5715694.1 glutamine--fructose-6-phosphate transaminase (isomerizing) [Patescibacteria group bacterium]
MCGIVGYIGSREATPVLLDGLKRLEYRGYDSAGIATVSDGINIIKAVGRIAALEKKLLDNSLFGTVGIAHTRWATHGEPSEVNAHPHTDSEGNIAIAHNGIIENYRSLKQLLQKEGHTFRSATDTEVIAHLIERYYEGRDFEIAVQKALAQLEGTYGLVAICTKEPKKLVVARNGSPIVIGVAQGEFFVASDAAALLPYTRNVVYLEDGEMAVVTKDGYRTMTLDNKDVKKEVEKITWDLEMIEKGGFPHFMLKEIYEQPQSIRNLLGGKIKKNETDVRMRCLQNGFPEHVSRIDAIKILACGTSWHAGLVGAFLMEKLLKVPVTCEQASEFRYRQPVMVPNSLAVSVSQSGETADTKGAAQLAKKLGAYSMGIVNVVGSTIARMVDGGVYLHAGPEIGVASTKAFSSQVVAFSLLNLGLSHFMDQRQPLADGTKRIPDKDALKIVHELLSLPEKIERVLQTVYHKDTGDGIVQQIAREYKNTNNFLYLGRGYNYPIALEGALKLKEISYIHAEGYSAAEMKHGPIALIDRNMPVVIIAPHDSEEPESYKKIASNAEEVRARGGRIIAVVNEGDDEISKMAEWVIEVPNTLAHLVPVLATVPLQLLAYEIAVLRGHDPDKPRNLAKSVTVE